MLDAPARAAVAVALVWGFAGVADSAQFSAIITEAAPPHAVGTALTLQTALGFPLTSIIAAVPHLRRRWRMVARVAASWPWDPSGA